MAGLTPGAATFIVGHPRSGTSLLRALLDGHPELLVLPFETHLFDWAEASDPARAVLDRTRLWPTLHRHRPTVTREEVEAALREAFGGTSAVRDRLLGLMRAWADLAGGEQGARWVEKTPRHLYELPVLLEWFGPDARALVLRRDPRDVAASQLKQDPTRSLFALALTCRLAHEALRDQQASERVRVLRYEDLVSDPEGAMRSACAFLDVSFHPSVTRPTVMGDAYSGNSRFEDTLDGVSAAPVGRHRDGLTPGQRRRLESLLEPVMAAGGYDVDGRGDGGGRRTERALLELVARSGLWRHRRVRSALRGG